VTAGDGLESFHVGWDAECVDDQQGAGAGCNGTLDRSGIEVQGDGINLREDRRGAHLKNGIGDGDEGEGRDDHLVAFADAEDEQSQMKACGAGADGYCMRNGVICGKCGFEGGEFGTQAEVRSAENGGDGVDFCVCNVGG